MGFQPYPAFTPPVMDQMGFTDSSRDLIWRGSGTRDLGLEVMVSVYKRWGSTRPGNKSVCQPWSCCTFYIHKPLQ